MVIHAPKGRKPYAGTPVGVEQSKAMISKLLRDFGVDGVQWSDNFDTGQVHLRFVVKKEDGRAAAFDIIPAPFMEEHKTYNARLGRSEVTVQPSWPRAMRALFFYLKGKLEAVAFGLTEVEREFLDQMVIRDSRGTETTVGEVVLPEIEKGGGRLALEAPPRPRGQVIESEGRTA